MPFALVLNPKNFSLQLFCKDFKVFQHLFIHDFCEVNLFEVILVLVLFNVVFSASNVDSYNSRLSLSIGADDRSSTLSGFSRDPVHDVPCLNVLHAENVALPFKAVLL